ncbi:MAG TPA: putative peptidoglycan binding domain-containing protein, partial [Terriglobales bacterium]|nr:putative peptidoglycan binding domain-containing protein [Terriglobales bacterium]
MLCIVLLCASLASARTKKAPRHVSRANVSSGTHNKVSSSHTRNKTRKGKASVPKVSRPRGQQTINDDRAREIQEALIKARYMDGEPSGTWDQQTRSA